MNLEQIDAELAEIFARSPWDGERGEIAETNMTAADQARRSDLMNWRGRIESDRMAMAAHNVQAAAEREREIANAAQMIDRICSAIEMHPALAARLRRVLEKDYPND